MHNKWAYFYTEIYSWIAYACKVGNATIMDFHIKKQTHKRRINIISRADYNYKRHAIKVSKELYYPKSVIEKLQNATTETEICRIMATARKEM